MSSDALDCCPVVGAEEADWLLCDAYRNGASSVPLP